MKATVEISMYPLKDTYEQEIIDFVLKLKEHKELTVTVNGISTQIFGEYDRLMQLLQGEIKEVLQNSRAVFVMKIAGGERKSESLPESLK